MHPCIAQLFRHGKLFNCPRVGRIVAYLHFAVVEKAITIIQVLIGGLDAMVYFAFRHMLPGPFPHIGFAQKFGVKDVDPEADPVQLHTVFIQARNKLLQHVPAGRQGRCLGYQPVGDVVRLYRSHLGRCIAWINGNAVSKDLS